MDEQIEIWKDIPGYEGLYAGSNLGRIKSYDRITIRRMNGGGMHPQKYKGRILRQYLNNCGYNYVRLCENGILVGYYVHILISKAFKPNADNALVVNHKDGNKLNNVIENLEWVTRSENQLHAYANGLQKIVRGEDHHLAKLKYHEVAEIIQLVNNGMPQVGVANRFNISKTLVNIIIKGKHRQYA